MKFIELFAGIGGFRYGIDNNGNNVVISDTQRYKCLGNAVTTNVITWIGTQLLGDVK